MSRNLEIARTILQQLGGNAFMVITGSKSPVAVENGLSIRLARNNSGANVLKIVLTPEDLYDVEFVYVSTRGLSVKKRVEGVYFDQLQDIFEQTTGLYTTLRPRRAA